MLNPVSNETSHPEPARRHGPAILALVALGALVWVFYLTTGFSGIAENDGYTYMASARAFLRGEGFRWEVRPVIDFSHEAEGRILSREWLRRGWAPRPLFPLVLSFFVGALGETDWAAVLPCGFFFLGTIPLVYLLGLRVYGQRAGLLAGALFVLNAKMLYYTISGHPLALQTFFLVSSALLALTDATWAALAASGALAALLWQTKDLGIVFLPLVAAFVLVFRARELRLRAAAPLLGAAAVAVLFQLLSPVFYPSRQEPEGRYVYVVPDAPAAPATESAERLAALSPARRAWHRLLSRMRIFSPLAPGHTAERSLDARLGWEAWAGAGAAMRAKVRTNLAESARVVFWQVTQPGVVALFWLGGLALIRRRGPRNLFLLSVLFLAAQTAVCAVFFVMHRYFHVFIPFLLVVAAGTLDALLTRIRRAAPRLPNLAEHAAAAGLVLALSFPFCFLAGVVPDPRLCEGQCLAGTLAQGERLARLGTFLRRHTRPDQVVVCDAPWVSWWHGDRTSVWLPMDTETLRRLQLRAQTDWLFITFQYWREMEFWKAWLARAGERGGRADGFRFVSAVVEGDYRAYLFRAELMESIDAARSQGARLGDPVP